jgi:3-dehydrotetronate 4-kinase
MSHRTSTLAPIKLGCIADDFTGATDLANNLVRSGMRCVQVVGVPTDRLMLERDYDAVVVALKTRTSPTQDAINDSLSALSWLQSLGAEQLYFKYCSTFDSTERGNIGPVTKALMQALNCPLTVVTPAFPDNARTIFKGHLFVGDVLLSDSPMRDHPLTPMRDSSLVRLMQSQFDGRVGLIDYTVVQQGAKAVESKLHSLKEEGFNAVVVDALSNTDLMSLGLAVKGMRLVTAGSGLAIGLAQNFDLNLIQNRAVLPKPAGFQAILSGSCSQMTQKQVAHFKAQGGACFALEPLKLVRSSTHLQQAVEWAKSNLAKSPRPILIYSTAAPEDVKSIQQQLTPQTAGEVLESAMGELAQALVEFGVSQLLVAGGETSGKCVQSLGLQQLQIGPQIDPGVPWCFAPLQSAGKVGQAGLHLALKSGNFGREDFFTYAWQILEESSL